MDLDQVDFKKLTENYRGLVNFAKGLREKNMDVKSVFENTPGHLKSFATKFSTFVSDMKAKLTFDFLDKDHQLRSMNLGPDNNANIVTITDWMVSALKHVITRVEQHGEILTVHTEALANPDEALMVAKDHEIKSLKEEIATLGDDVDETRQRGMLSW